MMNEARDRVLVRTGIDDVLDDQACVSIDLRANEDHEILLMMDGKKYLEIHFGRYQGGPEDGKPYITVFDKSDLE